MVSVIS